MQIPPSDALRLMDLSRIRSVAQATVTDDGKFARTPSFAPSSGSFHNALVTHLTCELRLILECTHSEALSSSVFLHQPSTPNWYRVLEAG